MEKVIIFTVIGNALNQKYWVCSNFDAQSHKKKIFGV